jgi:hypothetical protein
MARKYSEHTITWLAKYLREKKSLSWGPMILSFHHRLLKCWINLQCNVIQIPDIMSGIQLSFMVWKKYKWESGVWSYIIFFWLPYNMVLGKIWFRCGLKGQSKFCPNVAKVAKSEWQNIFQNYIYRKFVCIQMCLVFTCPNYQTI